MKIKCIQTFVYLGDRISVGEEFDGIKEFGDFYWIPKNNNIIEIPKRLFELVKENKGMDFHTKYSIGNKVFPVKASFQEVKIGCDLCDKTGKLTLKENVYFCPKCFGKGYTLQSEGGYKVDYAVPFIKDVFLGSYENGNSYINYNVTGKNREAQYKEEDLFLSELEAQLECDKRNAKK